MSNHLNTPQKQFWLWLASEISERMAENLPFIKIQPQKILFSGSFEHKTFAHFANVHPQALLWSDQKKRPAESFFKRINPFKNPQIHYFETSLTKAQEEFELVWVAPSRRDRASLAAFFADVGPYLKTQGLMMFSYLGPDTGKELRQYVSNAAYLGPDMHDTGDHLAQSGFADPVMHMEYICLEYLSCEVLIKDLLAIGLINDDEASSESLTKELHLQLLEQKKLFLTLEVVYGHAWKVPKKTPGITHIAPESIKKTYKNAL